MADSKLSAAPPMADPKLSATPSAPPPPPYEDPREKAGLDGTDASSVRSTSGTSVGSAQAGVKRIEATASTWGKKSLLVAYFSIYLMAFVTSMEQQSTYLYLPEATSEFQTHSLLAAVTTVQLIVLSVVKPPMSKIADVFGRFEAFAISVVLYVIGYIVLAASVNVRMYASAAIFYSAGMTGLQIIQQIFVADTSNLLNRALVSTIPDLPFLVTVWIGPELGQAILNGPGWRWGYGIWTIIIPVAFLPLALSLYLNSRKAARQGVLPPGPYAGQGPKQILVNLWYDMDFFGLILLTAGIALLLLPLNLAGGADGGWSNPSMIAMLVVGFVSLVAFVIWERNSTLAPYAFFPKNLFANKTVVAGVFLGFFYFMAFYLSVFPYFFSYLQVVSGKSPAAAGRITQVFSFSATVSSFAISFVIKYTKHYKYYITGGAVLYILGIGLMIAYREPGASTATLVGCQIVVGAGGGMLVVPAQVGVQASVSHQQVAAATAVFLTMVEIGGAVGSSISGAIWTNNLLAKLQAYLPAETQDQALTIYGSFSVAQNWPIGDPTRDAIIRAYQETMTKILIVGICMAIPILPLSLLMKNYKLDEVKQGVKGNVFGGDLANANSPARHEDSITDTATQPKTGFFAKVFRKSD